jgi:hypothetical protein
MAAINRELPFEPEVSLGPFMRVSRDDWDEERTGLDLFADGLIPSIPAPQLALVEPNFNAGAAKDLANLLRSLSIL